MTARPIVRAGDILFVRGSGILSRLIAWGERSKDESESAYPSHVALIVDDRGAIVEANSDGVDRTPDLFAKYSDAAHRVALYRPIGLSNIERLVMTNAGRRMVGSRYGYVELFVHLVDQKLFGGNVVARRLLKYAPARFEICSKVVAQAYAAIGRGWFGVPPYAAEPDDIYRWVRAHPVEFAPVFGFGQLVQSDPKEAA